VGMTRRSILLILFKLFDSALLVGSFLVATMPSLGSLTAISLTDFLAMRISIRNFVLFTALVMIWHLLFSFLDLYESKRLWGQRTEAVDVLEATSLATVALFVVGTFFIPSISDPKFLGLFWSISTATVLVSRTVLRSVLKQIRKRGRNTIQMLIVGTNPRAIMFARELESQSEFGYRIVGFVDKRWPGLDEFRKSGFEFASDFGGFAAFLRANVVDEVVIALPLSSCYVEASRIVSLCEEQGVVTHCLSNLFDLKLTGAKPEPLDYDSLITFHAGGLQGWGITFKRFLDIAISLSCLILLAPLLLITSALIKLTSRGPVLFVQKRLGLNKRLIGVYKFRTMVQNAEEKQAELEHLNEMSGPVFKITNDPRITSIGKFLRKTSIDELPQLLNVLKGDMSLVGPRPLPVRDYQGFNQDWQRRRFSIRPGITCLWQINGRSSIQFDKWMELDMEYIDRWSVWLDMQILIRTIPAVLRGSGAA
jgi:exopolysaccharide biosynthesis polyprenyl glycosylphosphotransferase